MMARRCRLRHPARAVVPPPRLRAKPMAFSAPLRDGRERPRLRAGEAFSVTGPPAKPCTGGLFLERLRSYPSQPISEANSEMGNFGQALPKCG